MIGSDFYTVKIEMFDHRNKIVNRKERKNSSIFFRVDKDNLIEIRIKTINVYDIFLTKNIRVLHKCLDKSASIVLWITNYKFQLTISSDKKESILRILKYLEIYNSTFHKDVLSVE